VRISFIRCQFLTCVRNDMSSGFVVHNQIATPRCTRLAMTAWRPRDSHVATALLLGMTTYQRPDLLLRGATLSNMSLRGRAMPDRGSLDARQNSGNSYAQILTSRFTTAPQNDRVFFRPRKSSTTRFFTALSSVQNDIAGKRFPRRANALLGMTSLW